MIHRLSLIAIPALVLLAGCDGMMPSGPATGTGIGAVSVDTAATTPEGTVAAQVAVPEAAGDCGRLALIVEDSASTEAARQAAIDERQRLGCP